MFTAGSMEVPVIIDISEKGLVGLCRESVLVCITPEGKYACECSFSDAPIAIGFYFVNFC